MIIQELPFQRIPDLLRMVSETLTEEYNLDILIRLHSSWPQGQLVLCSPDGQILGCLLGTWYDSREARVMMFAVRPEYQGMGLGGMLMQEFLRRVSHANGNAVRLEVRPGNEGAISFYVRRGFSVVGIIPYYYSDGGSGLVMRRFLNGTSDPLCAGYAYSRGISPSGSQTRPRTAPSCRSRNGP